MNDSFCEIWDSESTPESYKSFNLGQKNRVYVRFRTHLNVVRISSKLLVVLTGFSIGQLMGFSTGIVKVTGNGRKNKKNGNGKFRSTRATAGTPY
jgi:hypothetical protein